MSPDSPSPDATPPESGDEHSLQALILGEMAEPERERLLARLRAEPALRELYGEMIGLEAMLHHEFPRLADFREPAPLFRRPKRSAGYRLIRRQEEGVSPALLGGIVLGIAAALALLAGLWLWVRPDPRPVLVESYGESFWWDGAGRRVPLRAGEKMEATRALVTEGSGAYARLRFPDGSTAVLSGDGELRFREEKAKKLSLARGMLQVEMAKQPAGRPASVETPTARVEVVGTRFSVDAATADSTTIAVTEGRVNFRRLADGKAIEVARGWMATASLDVRPELKTLPQAEGKREWHASAGAAGNFKAEPFRAGVYDSGDRVGQPIIHHGIWFRRDVEGLVDLGEESRVRIRFKVADPAAHVRVFMVCADQGGGPLGNRQVQMQASALPADAGGWRTLDTGIARMYSMSPTGPFAIKDARVTALVISVLEAADGLEVSEAAITE